MSKHTAFILLVLLAMATTVTAQDTARVSLLLSLATRQIKKPGEFKTDLDSAADLIARARAINAKDNDPRCAGLIALTNSWLHEEEGHRDQAIALIHQKLYRREDITTVPMSIYLNEIASYLHDSFARREYIVFSLDLDPIDLDADQAIPIGLIVNETVTNSIKYAFPGDRRGLIGITMKRVSPEWIALIISDNGIGITQNCWQDESDSLGFNLIRGLSKSLRGELNIYSETGTTIELVFPLLARTRVTASF